MNLSERVKRVSTLPPSLHAVLACVAKGMSNDQIARSLSYKNAGTVATLVTELYNELGLRSVVSIIEKRMLAAQAFRRATERELKIFVRDEEVYLLPLSDPDKKRLRTALRDGYKIDSIVLRKG